MEIIVIGAGGHGSEVCSYVQDIAAVDARIHLVGFIDEGKPPGTWNNTRILGDFQDLAEFLRENSALSFRYITAVGDNEIRRTLVAKAEGLQAPNLEPWSLIHPKATMGRDVTICQGFCAAPGSIVTTRVRIGGHCILNVNASLSHDCVIGDFVNINPGAVIAGGVRIGEGSFIGASSTVIENVSVGEWAVIGAGAVVINDIPSHSTAIGVPARVIKRAGRKEHQVAAR